MEIFILLTILLQLCNCIIQFFFFIKIYIILKANGIYKKRHFTLTEELHGLIVKKQEILDEINCIHFCNRDIRCHYVSFQSELCILYSFYARYYFQNSNSSYLYEKLNQRE